MILVQTALRNDSHRDKPRKLSRMHASEEIPTSRSWLRTMFCIPPVHLYWRIILCSYVAWKDIWACRSKSLANKYVALHSDMQNESWLYNQNASAQPGLWCLYSILCTSEGTKLHSRTSDAGAFLVQRGVGGHDSQVASGSSCQFISCLLKRIPL